VKPIVGGLLNPVMVKWLPTQQLLTADDTLETKVPDGIIIMWTEVNIDLGNIVKYISGNVLCTGKGTSYPVNLEIAFIYMFKVNPVLGLDCSLELANKVS